MEKCFNFYSFTSYLVIFTSKQWISSLKLIQLYGVTDLCKFWIQNWLVCCSEWFTSVKTFVYPWMSQYQSSKTMLNYHGPVLPPIKDFDSKWNRVENWTRRKIFILMKTNRAKRQYWNQKSEIKFWIKQWNFGSSLCLYGFGNFYWESLRLMKKFRVT